MKICIIEKKVVSLQAETKERRIGCTIGKERDDDSEGGVVRFFCGGRRAMRVLDNRQYACTDSL